MSFVKINEQGWDKFTGDLGGIDFVDGISTRELTEKEVNRLSAGMRIESIDTGLQLGIGVQLTTSGNDPMTAESYAVNQDDAIEFSEPGDELVAPLWTRKALEDIADKDGIAAIRVIADPLNVKGKSIAHLIDGILGNNS